MAQRKNTTQQGDLFRDSVLQLISLCPGVSNVQREFRVGSQDVDIYYEEQTSFGILRIACECKDYQRPLTRDQIASKIFPRYQPLMEQRLVDVVRVIAPRDIGVDAQQYLKDIRFNFITRARLEEEIIDFRGYMRSLVAAYNEDGLQEYFIQPIMKDGRALEDAIQDWLNGETDQPIAIISGYGMGKTSFSRYLAFKQAQAYLSGKGARIPIRIPLSEISSEQGLEGLIGKLLAAQNLVRNYHFGLFMELVRRGRLLTILDGFDEMKHAMSWAEFKHNFKELNRLIVPSSRVILLGRPSALMSEAEHMFVLRGARKHGRNLLRVPGTAEFRELPLELFSREQALTCVEKHTRYRLNASSRLGTKTVDATTLNDRLEMIRDDEELQQLIQRPVQARMVADLALDPGVKWRSFSRFQLYYEFMFRLVDREGDKPTRSEFSVAERHAFHCRLAWWVWQRSQGTSFQLDSIPDALFPETNTRGESVDTERVRRDLLAGSVLDEKSAGYFYFPHRSFVEFLVAEYIRETMWDAGNLQDVDLALNEEICTFVEEAENYLNVESCAGFMNSVEAPLSLSLLRLIGLAVRAGAEEPVKWADEWASPRDLITGYLGIPATDTEARTRYLIRSLQRTADIETRMMCVMLACWLERDVEERARGRLLRQIAAFLFFEAHAACERLTSTSADSREQAFITDPFLVLMGDVIGGAAERFPHAVTLSADRLVAVFFDSIKPKWRVRELKDLANNSVWEVPITDLANWESSIISGSSLKIAEFVRNFHSLKRTLLNDPPNGM
jgi:hypothetical protein